MKQTKLTTKDLTAIGSLMATQFIEADQKADSVKQEILLSTAKAHAGDVDRTKTILTAFFDTFVNNGMSNNSAKVRKSEARKVFEAVAKTQVSEDNYKTLEQFNGGYHEFIGLARDLAKEENAESKTSNRKPVVTEKQEDYINDKIKVAKVIQISDFMQTGVDALNAPRDDEGVLLAERQQFILIASIADKMSNNEQYDDVSRKVASEIYKLANVQINRMEKVAKKAEEATEAVM